MDWGADGEICRLLSRIQHGRVRYYSCNNSKTRPHSLHDYRNFITQRISWRITKNLPDSGWGNLGKQYKSWFARICLSLLAKVHDCLGWQTRYGTGCSKTHCSSRGAAPPQALASQISGVRAAAELEGNVPRHSRIAQRQGEETGAKTHI